MNHESALPGKQEVAARLAAADELPDEAIAAECTISRSTLKRWRRRPDFQARIEYHRNLWRRTVEREGIADRTKRVRSANDRWKRLQLVIDARASDPLMEDVPGGSTGLLVAEPMLVKVQTEVDEKGRLIPVGPSEIVYKFGVDTALLAEMRALEKQTAQELGQWTERRELTGKGGGPIEMHTRVNLTKLSNEELAALEQLVDKAADQG